MRKLTKLRINRKSEIMRNLSILCTVKTGSIFVNKINSSFDTKFRNVVYLERRKRNNVQARVVTKTH